MTFDETLVPAAIVEYYTARDRGLDETAAWTAAVSRVRYDVLRMAAVICRTRAAEHPRGYPGAEAGEDCAHAIEQAMRHAEG